MDRALILAMILHPARNYALLFADYTRFPAETVLTRDANSRRDDSNRNKSRRFIGLVR